MQMQLSCPAVSIRDSTDSDTDLNTDASNSGYIDTMI